LKKIEKAIKYKKEIKIVYLKPNDEKTERIIIPETIEEMEFSGKRFIGVKAFCKKRNEYRNFRIDRIIDIIP
jgi:predicted DNA-binding transcriptional regulator YafY